MKYLLDTCVISEFKKTKFNPNVIEWIDSQKEENLFLSVFTIAEIQKGISKLPDSEKKEKLQLWLDDDLQQRFFGRILEINIEIASCWGLIQGKAELRGKKMSVVDGLIAATGIVNDYIVATRNVTDMVESGCKIFNPWE